ncbi:MAG TPA: TetR/AcrR family transcriptional regulator [Conexibacter sp.]|nr:TetR/AcrR family transcriptional regulator [Conexibacter sp.]
MSASTTPPSRRADAERNVAAIVAAGLDVLATRPDAGLSAVAEAAGVTRTTVYAHFPTRAALVGAVLDAAIAEAAAALDGAEPDSGPPDVALARMVAASWQTIDRQGRLMEAVGQVLSEAECHARHRPVGERVARTLRRGQDEGRFRDDVPIDWLLAVTYALVHAAAAEVAAGRLPAERAGELAGASVLAACAAPR